MLCSRVMTPLVFVAVLVAQTDAGIGVDPRVGLAQDLRLADRRPEALELLAKVITDATTAKDDLSRGRALQRAGDVQLDLHECELAKREYLAALKSLSKVSDPLPRVQVLNDLGLRGRRCSELGEAKKYFSQALAYYREVKDQAGIRKLANNLGSAHSIGGDMKKALVAFREAEAAARALSDDDGLLTVEVNICAVELALSEEKLALDCRQFTARQGTDPGYQRALAAMKEAIAIQEKRGAPVADLCGRFGREAGVCESCVLNVLQMPK